MKTKETRAAEMEATDELTLEGWPVIFDSPTTIHDEYGDYTEIIHRGALDQCDLTDSTLIYNHDQARVPLARSGRTMTLEVADKGLHMVAHLNGESEQAREVYASCKRGDLSGMSFAFTVPEGGSRFDGNTNTRHIDQIAKIYEVSVCPFPAYQSASVEARNAMTAARDGAIHAAMRAADRTRALIRAYLILEEKK